MKAIQRATPKPAWFTVRFDQTSEWATLHVPEAHAVEWLRGAARLFNETHLWDELLGVQAILLEQIKRRDWAKVSPWHLVHHLKVAHDVKVGMAHFLPPPYRDWPIEMRQALYLAHCLMKGHAMIEDNPAEDFGLPELAHSPLEVRPVLAAVKPLWNCLAEPAVRAAIEYHRSHHETGFDAGLLKLVTELGESPDATHWLTLLGETPEAVCKRMMEIPKLRMADHVYKSREPEGNVSSEVFFGLSHLMKKDNAASALARAMEGGLDGWPEMVRQNVRDAKPNLVVKFDDAAPWLAKGGLPDAEVIEADAARDDAIQHAARLKDTLQDPKLPVNLRQLLTLLLEDPDQTDVTLGRKLKKSSATIGNWKRKLAARSRNLR